jgi:glycosyltransferase involved in cell wall biosynthesis
MSDPRTIYILGPAHPLRGGLASYDERLARAFNQSGWRSRIITFSLQYPGFLFPGTTQFSSEPPPADLDIRVEVNSVNPVNWLSVGNRIALERPDVIVVRYWLPFMGPCLGTILRRVRRNGHTRIICIADNIVPHEKRPGDVPFTRYFVKAIDGFITMSQKVLGDLKVFAPGKPARFVPHPLYDNFGEPMPIAEARHALGIDARDKVILFFGFIRKYKGLDLLFQAMADERVKVAGCKLLVAGEFYEDKQPYLDLAAQLGIGDRLILRTEFIPDSKVREYLCAADLVVQPYRQATQSGVTPLAYHFEKPMLVTRVGALPDMVPDDLVGIVTEPDPAAIAEGILRFFEKGADHYLPHLREEKKKYAWSTMVRAITEIADGIQK